jgi:hypothetical protein
MPGSLTLPEGMYGIYAELGVYLVEESGVKVPGDTLVGRLEKHIEREVETLTAGEFLTRIQGVAAQAGMKHVIAVEKDDVTIYASDQESEENWDAGFRAAIDAEGASGGTDSWWVLMSGWNGDLKFRQDITFRRKHTLASPSMTLVIRALPAVWGMQPDEDFAAWMSRLRSALANKQEVKDEEGRSYARMEKYLEDYEQLLRGAFAVRDFSKDMRINLSQIDPESFERNYSAEQST